MIKFPKMHIAQSVVNQILNVHDEIVASRPLPQPVPMPSPQPVVPDPALDGMELGAALEQPVPPVTADDQTVETILLSGLMQ